MTFGERRSRLKSGNKPLRADPEKVRAWQDRSRQPLERDPEKGLKRTELERGPVRRKPPQNAEEGPLTAAQWRVQAFLAAKGRCRVTGARARDADDSRFHAHHPFPKGVLRELGLYAVVWDPRNACWVTRDVRANHEGAHVRIPRSRLPSSVWAFTAMLDGLPLLGRGAGWATALVEREHPET